MGFLVITQIGLMASLPGSPPSRSLGPPPPPPVLCRSITILPQALSPHSLASVPSLGFDDTGTSFTFSVPRNFSGGGGLGVSGGGAAASEYEDESGNGGYSDSEASETDTDRGGGDTSREASQHGPSGRLPALGRGGGGDAGGRQP